MIFRFARKVGISRFDWSSLQVVAISSLAVVGVLLGVRQLGGLQPIELITFDYWVRLRPRPTEPDPRILVVAITEKDIDRLQQWPLSDRVLAQVFSTLQAEKPTVIGLDLYRNIPIAPGYNQLAAQLQQPNVIAIQSIDSLAGTPPPPAVAPERVGFNDVPLDADGVVRRNLLFAQGKTDILYSFSLRLALAYLEQQDIFPEASQRNPDDLQLGPAVFEKLEKDAGGYQSVEAEGYQILLNYRSPDTIARQISITQVLSGQFDPSWVQGKIVIIGSTASSLKDTFTTPYSPALKKNYKMPGVLIHTQMVSQILDAATGDRSLLWYWPESTEVLWIIGWIIIGGIVGRMTYHPLALSLGVGSGLAGCAGICIYVLIIRGGWIPFASPALGFVLTASIVVSYRAYQAQQKQQIVMKLLGQNTSPEIAQALWQGRDRLLKSGKLPGIRLNATMLFADVKDFSTISEQMTPEALLEWLNELLEAITQEVIKRQGIVNKFTGDGLMAIFGVPTSRLNKTEVAEDARAAVACALAMSDRLEEMNQKWQLRGLPVIQMRVGIFTGPIVAGSLGGKDRLEYGVIGDSVNTAARLESCEKDRHPTNCRILIAYETLIHLQGEYEVESWGLLALKGKQQMVDVYRVVGLKQDTQSAVTNESLVAIEEGRRRRAQGKRFHSPGDSNPS